MEKKVKVGLNYTQYNGKWQETQKRAKGLYSNTHKCP